MEGGISIGLRLMLSPNAADTIRTSDAKMSVPRVVIDGKEHPVIRGSILRRAISEYFVRLICSREDEVYLSEEIIAQSSGLFRPRYKSTKITYYIDNPYEVSKPKMGTIKIDPTNRQTLYNLFQYVHDADVFGFTINSGTNISHKSPVTISPLVGEAIFQMVWAGVERDSILEKQTHKTIVEHGTGLYTGGIIIDLNRLGVIEGDLRPSPEVEETLQRKLFYLLASIEASILSGNFGKNLSRNAFIVDDADSIVVVVKNEPITPPYFLSEEEAKAWAENMKSTYEDIEVKILTGRVALFETIKYLGLIRR